MHLIHPLSVGSAALWSNGPLLGLFAAVLGVLIGALGWWVTQRPATGQDARRKGGPPSR